MLMVLVGAPGKHPAINEPFFFLLFFIDETVALNSRYLLPPPGSHENYTDDSCTLI